MNILSRTSVFAGELVKIEHASIVTHCDMWVSVYRPRQALLGESCPVP